MLAMEATDMKLHADFVIWYIKQIRREHLEGRSVQKSFPTTGEFILLLSCLLSPEIISYLIRR